MPFLPLILAAAIAATAPAASVSTTPADIAEPNPAAMSQKEIRAFNATVPANHPYHIRCVASEETGSLVRKTYTCRTNERWHAASNSAGGEQGVRDTVESLDRQTGNLRAF